MTSVSEPRTAARQVRAGTVERIIVAKVDRLTRSVRDLAELIELCGRAGLDRRNVRHFDSRRAARRKRAAATSTAPAQTRSRSLRTRRPQKTQRRVGSPFVGKENP